VWREFLRNLRKGEVTEADVQMLQTLVIDQPGAFGMDVNSEEWRDAPLVTTRHAVRVPWNEESARRDCKRDNQQLFVCGARDLIRGKPLTMEEQHALAAKIDNKGGTQLPDTVELAVGMKVLVTSNLDTDLDITNGASGEIVGIVLQENERPTEDSPIHVLQNVPVYILVKLTRTRLTALEGLEECVVPIEPSTVEIPIIMIQSGKKIKKTVRRTQFPITPAYALTDYRSQGQTLHKLLIDIQTPPGPKALTLFSLYVMMSRSPGRSSIRILRPFDPKIFQQSHDPDLIEEDKRLETRDTVTKDWWACMRETTGAEQEG
jgi:hypothetical protein